MARYCIGEQFDQEQIKQKTAFHNMKAKDEKGHMRWQGAFTGGFTAGYKNTCGSKEGWAPSTFQSSRQKRSTHERQEIHQFMDNQDMGKSKLSENIKITNNFKRDDRLLKIGVESSIGQQMLNRLRRQKAVNDKPEDEEDLSKLLEKYQNKEENESLSLLQNNIFSDKQDYTTLGYSHFNEIDDDFINQNSEMFYQLINKKEKEETEEDKKKRKEQNRISFDYSRPLDQRDQYGEESTMNSTSYLKQIVQFSDPGPQKKPRLSVNSYKIKNLFVKEETVKQNEKMSIYPQVPKDFDPYKRMREYSEAKGVKTAPIDEQFHKLSIQQRSKMLGERNPIEFRRPLNHDFVKEQMQQTTRQFESFEKQYVLMDSQKQKRYQEFVLEQQGKVIASSDAFGGLDWNKAQEQKQMFQKLYKKSLQNENSAKNAFLDIENNKSKRQQGSIILGRADRTIKQWRPQKLLCKRFGLLTPYMNK